MSVEVFMPKLGLTMVEGTVVRWLKKENDYVRKEEAIAEISSEKITNEVEAEVSGILEKIVVAEGQSVPYGAVIAYIGESEAAAAASETSQAGISKPSDPDEVADYEEKPLTALRKTIGERMSESLRRSPQGTMTTRADMTGMIALKNKYASLGQKVTFTDLFIKVVSVALLANPGINCAIHEGKVRMYKKTNIGVVVGNDEATYSPVIKNVEKKNVLEISKELKELVKKINGKRITPEDMSGSTFTISNLGMMDVDIITPIINPPEAAILAIGTTRREVVVDENGGTTIKPLATLGITADHTLVDGVPAVKFLNTVKEIMRNPEQYFSVE